MLRSETPTQARRGRRLLAGAPGVLLVVLMVRDLAPADAGPVRPLQRSEIIEWADEATPRDPVHDYLDAAFGLFLGRPPTPQEIEQWSFATEVGDLESVTRALAVSDERTGARISQLYESALGRPADTAGRAHWLAEIARGDTPELIAARLYGSTEYYLAAGSTPQGFVDQLYQDLLGRRADPGGRAFWLDHLARGHSRTSVATAFHDSVESRTERVAELYQTVLGRRADAGADGHWVQRVREVGDAALASALASSGEFFQQVTDTPLTRRLERGHATGFEPFASTGELNLVHPAKVVDVVGFHQASSRHARPLTPAPTAVDPTVLGSRGRGTDRYSASDIVVPPGEEIVSPVTGHVISARQYRLYCRHADEQIVIEPDELPGWRVFVLHVTGANVRAGDRVVAGLTKIADHATILPFPSQVEKLTSRAPWPHVHIEVSDAPPSTGAPGAC
jgi:hypothetical protein